MQPIGPGDLTAPGLPIPPTQVIPQPPTTVEEPERSRLGFVRDPLSMILVLVIVVSLVVAGLLGGELYARHRADAVVASAVECIVQDKTDVSFGMRPLLYQLVTSEFSSISVETAGNQIRAAKGMKLDLHMEDIRLHKTADSEGTMGALDAVISWSTDGIKETVRDAIPFLGSLVSRVTTNPSDGTIELEGSLGSVIAKPQVTNGGLELQVLKLSGLGLTLPKETVQPALDTFTGTLTRNLPMGIHADSVQITDDGVTAKFITRNATIPTGQQDPCFSGV
ncbi:MAG: DUF2993 domain-containing protein [Mycobacterium sp.]